MSIEKLSSKTGVPYTSHYTKLHCYLEYKPSMKIHVYLLGKPKDWEPHPIDIQRNARVSRYQYEQGMAYLHALKLIRYEILRDRRGRFCGRRIHVNTGQHLLPHLDEMDMRLTAVLKCGTAASPYPVSKPPSSPPKTQKSHSSSRFNRNQGFTGVRQGGYLYNNTSKKNTNVVYHEYVSLRQKEGTIMNTTKHEHISKQECKKNERIQSEFTRRFANRAVKLEDILDGCIGHYEKKKIVVDDLIFLKWLQREKETNYTLKSKTTAPHPYSALTEREQELVGRFSMVQKYPRLRSAFFASEEEYMEAEGLVRKVVNTQPVTRQGCRSVLRVRK